MSKKPSEIKAKPENAEETTQTNEQEKLVPQINILAQYIKDFSFENPKAPASLRPKEGNPNVNININVNAKPIENTDYEVDIKLDAKISHQDEVLFNAEIIYGGVFRLQNVQKDHIHPMVMIECPRLIFPFARQVISNITREAGFPPLMIDPVDFAALYRKRLEQIQAQQNANGKPN